MITAICDVCGGNVEDNPVIRLQAVSKLNGRPLGYKLVAYGDNVGGANRMDICVKCIYDGVLKNWETVNKKGKE